MAKDDGSASLENARWEKFAQNCVKGMSQDEAYVEAGFKRNSGNANRLAQRPEVVARIAFLQSRAAERALITADDIARQLDADRDFARAEKQAGAAVSATMGKAKVLGLIIERHRHAIKNVDEMNEDELRQFLGETS